MTIHFRSLSSGFTQGDSGVVLLVVLGQSHEKPALARLGFGV